MTDDEFDWHASEMAKTNPNVAPPELPNDPQTVAGEVVATAQAPELVEISTIRVLGDLVGTRLEAPVPEIEPAGARDSMGGGETPAEDVPARTRLAPLALALAVLVLAAMAWALA